MSIQLGEPKTTLQYHHSSDSKMGDGSKSKTPKVTSRMPVSALSAECRFKEIVFKAEYWYSGYFHKISHIFQDFDFKVT